MLKILTPEVVGIGEPDKVCATRLLLMAAIVLAGIVVPVFTTMLPVPTAVKLLARETAMTAF